VLRRRRVLLALVAFLLLAGGAGAYVYVNEVQPPGDVFNP
jgi:hypothetical protein